MRTQGSLRVVLNTKIWPGMTIERASAKSVRITAMDTDESIKIFLIMVCDFMVSVMMKVKKKSNVHFFLF